MTSGLLGGGWLRSLLERPGSGDDCLRQGNRCRKSINPGKKTDIVYLLTLVTSRQQVSPASPRGSIDKSPRSGRRLANHPHRSLGVGDLRGWLEESLGSEGRGNGEWGRSRRTGRGPLTGTARAGV